MNRDLRIGEYAWQVRSYECGADGLMTMPSLCNYLQEAASLHAERLGFSKSDFLRGGHDVTWVLTRLMVRLERLPKWAETVTVRTWPRTMRRIVAYRDFELYDADGVRIGAATSEWMLIDMTTRKLVPLPAELEHDGGDIPPALGEDPFGARPKFPAAATPDHAEMFTARRCHIDVNRHVNNVHYVTWALETVPQDERRSCVGLDITFRAETHAGETVRGECVRNGDGGYLHRLIAPDGKEHVVMTSTWR